MYSRIFYKWSVSFSLVLSLVVSQSGSYINSAKWVATNGPCAFSIPPLWEPMLVLCLQLKCGIWLKHFSVEKTGVSVPQPPLVSHPTALTVFPYAESDSAPLLDCRRSYPLNSDALPQPLLLLSGETDGETTCCSMWHERTTAPAALTHTIFIRQATSCICFTYCVYLSLGDK